MDWVTRTEFPEDMRRAPSTYLALSITAGHAPRLALSLGSIGAEVTNQLLPAALPWRLGEQQLLCTKRTGPIKHLQYFILVGKIVATVEASLIAPLCKGDGLDDNIKRTIYGAFNFGMKSIPRA